ncbi:pyridoxamine 5'-phosphate oxidase family protein [Streptosporangium saharense]|uniref:pyridoxamine 5'-phosphate oxidase family protein n=1 Tax=Streptosporangium saharense TaxID=1706840 RepID=UPI003439A729
MSVDQDALRMTPVTSEEELREIVKPPPKAIAEKAIDHIDQQSRLFIEASPFLLLATVDDEGNVDVSPRGDPPGSVLVLDDRTLAIADRRGNRRLDSMRNILRRPKVATLFVVPGMAETLRVNGHAVIVRDAPFFERMTVQGSTPQLAIVLTVEELFLHCAKAFLRSSLWKPQSWPDRATLPSAGRIVKSQTGSRIPESVFNAGLNLDAKRNQY